MRPQIFLRPSPWPPSFTAQLQHAVESSGLCWPKLWELGPHVLFPGPFLADFVKTERDESTGPKSLKSFTSHDPMKQWEPTNR